MNLFEHPLLPRLQPFVVAATGWHAFTATFATAAHRRFNRRSACASTSFRGCASIFVIGCGVRTATESILDCLPERAALLDRASAACDSGDVRIHSSNACFCC
jgi:hypothetical protein